MHNSSNASLFFRINYLTDKIFYSFVRIHHQTLLLYNIFKAIQQNFDCVVILYSITHSLTLCCYFDYCSIKKSLKYIYCIGGVMISMLASSAVECGFQPRLGQTKDYRTGICCFSAKHATLRKKTGWLEIWIMCPNGVTWLYPDCFFSELAL